MRIAMGADHAGWDEKRALRSWLEERSYEVLDVGTDGADSVDYPDFAAEVGAAVSRGAAELGILVCGSGIGMSIAANKVPGVRAAVCTDPYSARLARGHNNANVLCLGARITGPGLMRATVDAFLDGAFEGGRHARRVEKIRQLESEGDVT